MAQDWTSTALIASVRRRGMIPNTTEALATADYLAIATEELQSDIFELWVASGGEYAVTDYDVAIVAGTSSYTLHSRSAGEVLRQVLMLQNSVYTPLARAEPETANEWNYANTSSGTPSAYYFKDDAVVLVPTPSAAGTLRLQYLRRPNSLVATSAVATVASYTGATITTTATIPSTITASSISVDIVGGTPGFRTKAQAYTTTTGTTGTTIVLTANVPTTVVAGDYVCLAGESPVAQIPPELHPLLAQRVTQKCLEALGDPKAAVAAQEYERMRARALSLITPRSAGEPRYIVNKNGPGFGYRRGFSRGW